LKHNALIGRKGKDTVIKNIARYSSSNIYRQFLALFTAFIRPKLLTPELYGLWNILNLIPRYSSYIHLGSRSSIRYLIPYYESKNEIQKINEIKGSVFYGSLYLNLLLVSGFVILSLKASLNLEVRLGLIAMAAIVIMGWYYDYYISILKSHQNFTLITSSNYLKASIMAVLSIILIYFFKIYGVYLTAVLTLIVIILYLRSNHPLEPHSKFCFKVFKDLVKMGFPIMTINIITLLISTSDRFIVSYFLGYKQLGYYSIAIMVLHFLENIPAVAREVIEPRLMQSLSENSSEKNLNKYFLKPLINTAYYMPFLVGLVIFVFPVLIPIILPRYIPGIPPTIILVIGGYFLFMSYTARGIIVANNLQLKASVVMAFVLLINITLSISFVKSGMGIKGVALGSSISYFILFISLLYFVKKKCSYDLQDWKINMMGLCWPFPIMCAAIVILKSVSEVMHINDYMAAFMNLFVYCMIMFIVVNIAGKKYILLKMIRLKELW